MTVGRLLIILGSAIVGTVLIGWVTGRWVLAAAFCFVVAFASGYLPRLMRR